MTLIKGVWDVILFWVGYRSFQTGYVAYRLLKKVMFQPVVAILNKQNKAAAYKKTWKKEVQGLLSILEFSSGWSKHIPPEILELILQRLPLIDYLRFGAVCSSWQSVVAKVIAEKRCPPAPELPLLMLCAHPYTSRNHCFLSMSSNRILYAPNCLELHKQRCAGSIEGWLVMSDFIMWRPEGFINDFCRPLSFKKVKNFFLNPISGAQITLPSQTTIPSPLSSDPEMLYKVVVSAVPTSPNCIVAAVCLGGALAFCSLANNSWYFCENEYGLRFEAIEFHDGQLYAIPSKFFSIILVFELQEFSRSNRRPRVRSLVILPPLTQFNVTGRMEMEGHTQYYYDVPAFYLVNDHASNDLLKIIHYSDGALDEEYFVSPMSRDYTVPPRIKAFQVFKLDRSASRWVQIDSLGDRIVFISQTNSMIVSVSNIGKSHKELTSNCIYFALDYPCTTSPAQGRDVGVFCLEDGSIKRPFPSVPRSWLTLLPVWFTPKL